MHLNDLLEEFTALTELHDYMNIPVIDVSFMKFDNVRVVDLCQYRKFFLEKFNILLNILFQDTLHSILNLRIQDSVRKPNRTKMSSTD